MAFYSVHSREGYPAEQALFVREGFSFAAFLFTVVWALWHRMWLAAGILLALSGALALAGNLFGIGDGVIVIAGFAVNLIFGLEARNLQIRSLIERGYRQVGYSHGKNLDEAEIRYFHTNSRPQPQPGTVALKTRPFSGEPDTLGIFGNV